MNSITRPDLLRPDDRRVLPTRQSSALFAVKAAGLRLRRGLVELPRPLPKLKQAAADHPILLAESVTPLWSDPRQSEARMQFGKVENLRRAAAMFDRLEIPEGGVFSFWKQLGRPSQSRGFV